jgi:hypothetical protein
MKRLVFGTMLLGLVLCSCHNTEIRFYESLDAKPVAFVIDEYGLEPVIRSSEIGKIHAPDSFLTFIEVRYKGEPILADAQNMYGSLSIDSFCVSFFDKGITTYPPKVYELEEYAHGYWQLFKHVTIPKDCDSIEVSLIARIFSEDLKTALKKEKFSQVLYRHIERHSYYFD